MDVNYRAALVLVKVQDPPCSTCALLEPVAEKALTVTPDEVDKAPEKALVLDPSIWFTKSRQEKPGTSI